MNIRARDIPGALAAIALCEAVGLAGAWATAGSVSDWYPTLNKPSFNPPAWVFGPVWTLLYAMMGLAAYLVVRQGWRRGDVRRALGAFVVQLALNFLWSFLFFGLQRPLWAFVDILLLLVAIAVTTVLFWKIHQGAGALMIPYLLWVAFASVLNGAIVVLN